MEKVLQRLREAGQPVYSNQGIVMATVETPEDGFALTQVILQSIFDKKTVLFLSGGKTPRELYASLAADEDIQYGAVALVDERFGAPMHEQSNERMLKESGLLRMLDMRDIPFYSILSSRHPHESEDLDSRFRGNDEGIDREEMAENYDQKVRELLATYQKHVAILGVGMDGHTAGLPVLKSKVKSQKSNVEDVYERSKNRMVIDYNDEKGFYKERITMTFAGLSMMDILIVLVFGEDKKEALTKMLSDGPEEDIPSRFLKRPNIAAKTLVITDQEV